MFLAQTGFLYAMVPYNAAASISDISDIIWGISWAYLGNILGISGGYLGHKMEKWPKLFSLLFWPQIISLGKYNRLETAYIEKFANMFYAEKKKKWCEYILTRWCKIIQYMGQASDAYIDYLHTQCVFTEHDNGEDNNDQKHHFWPNPSSYNTWFLLYLLSTSLQNSEML